MKYFTIIIIILKFNEVLLVTGGGGGGAGSGHGCKNCSCGGGGSVGDICLGSGVLRGGHYGVFHTVGFGCFGDGVVVVVVVDVVFVMLFVVVAV
jgi:hypothetical protein